MGAGGRGPGAGGSGALEPGRRGRLDDLAAELTAAHGIEATATAILLDLGPSISACPHRGAAACSEIRCLIVGSW